MTERDLVIGIDTSTTAAKAVVWNSAGTAVSMARTEIALAHPRPTWAEQSAADWWTATQASIRRAVSTVDRARIAALCVTHQRETFACLDAAGEPIRPALIWADTRATGEVREFGTAEVHRITGKPPNPTPAWYKMLWLARNEPDVMAHTARFVDVQGFLVHHLTGRWVTSWASADPLGLVDLSTFDYSDELLGLAGITRDRLCELTPPGAVLGDVEAGVAESLGLPGGVRVVAGLGDGQAAQLGCGISGPGSAYLNLGTGVVSGTHSDSYAYAVEFRTLASGIPGAYTLETFIGGGTYNVRWFVDRFAGVDTRALGLDLTAEQVLEAAAAKLPPGSDSLLALPYWTGALTPYWDPDARGAFIGLTGSRGKAHVYRALLESIAFEQRMLTTGAEAAVGTPITSLIALGGGSKSPVWCQIIADVLRRRIDVVGEAESTCLGAGMLAAAAVGIHPDIPTAIERMSSRGAHFEPVDKVADVYDPLYRVYVDLYPALRQTFSRLAALGSS